MNYLAHAYLSFDKGEILIGNFMADTVKGNTKHYNEQIRKGIRLHHLIDDFTDNNEHFKRSAGRLGDKFGFYSPVIIDMFYDHFLAVNWKRYHEESLSGFIWNVYKTMLSVYPVLPLLMKRMLPYMVMTNWLEYYKNPYSFRLFFKGLSMRTRHPGSFNNAAPEIFKHYDEFDHDFNNFMSEIIPYVKNLPNY